MNYTHYTHLHVHSHYSLLDGLASPEELIQRATELKMPSLALTDHGNMYGAIEFYTLCREYGIKPIIGLEAYMAVGPLTKKDFKKGEKCYTHLTLLAKDKTGYHNLMRLASIGYTKGFYYRPRIDMETLKVLSDGLVILSGCMFSELSQACIFDQDIVAGMIRDNRNQFKENYYVEVQDFGIPEQLKIREFLPEVASSLGVPVVATNDVHYVYKDDTHAHEALLCIGTGTNVKDPKRLRFPTSELYLKSYDEMNELWPFAYLDVTQEISDKCNVEIELNRKFNILHEKGSIERIKEKCYEQLNKFARSSKRIEQNRDKYKDRLVREIDAIIRTGHEQYIECVSDFVAYAKSSGIPVGSGRGSSAGSLVCFLLGITEIDPIEHDLLFERFINVDRLEPPDIDVDVCQSRRGEVLAYLKKKYGDDRVAQIITFGSLRTKAAIKDVCRVLQLPFGLGDDICKLLGDFWEGSMVEAFNRADISAYLSSKLDQFQITEFFQIASKIENRLRHSSTHAAGIVISDVPLIEVSPLCKKTGSDELMTQYDMASVAKLGLLKFDILGLRTLTVIQEACSLASLNPNDIPLDDEYVFTQLSKGDTPGIFQYEGFGYTRFIKQMKPKCFNDLVALGALFRPGPLESGVANDYLDRMHGSRYENEFPGITDDTYGIMLYQEQVMKVVVKYAGFTLNEADILRKAIGKKDKDLMERMLARIKDKVLANKIVTFARYGWNKAHAVSYAILSYRTAWLRFNKPVEFWCAELNSEIDNSKRFPFLLHAAEKIDKVEVYPPHINISDTRFKLYNGNLYAGLLAIKGIGEKVCEAILAERLAHGPYAGELDLRSRIPPKSLNCRALEALVNADTFRDIVPLTEFEKFQMEVQRAIECECNTSVRKTLSSKK